jgi:hypothetical protein
MTEANKRDLKDLLEYTLDHELDHFTVLLEDDDVLPDFDVDPEVWKKEVDRYFDMCNDHNATGEETNEQLDFVAMMSRGHAYCSALRLYDDLIQGE